MNAGLHYLITAKRCEIADLELLVHTISLVNVTGRLVHALQRERGLTNMYLAPAGDSARQPLLAQIAHCQALEAELRASYEPLAQHQNLPGHGARLFNRMAYASQGLDALALIRAEVDARRWTGARATDGYIKVIAGVLSVVFEATDTATDPDVSRQLVALYNFMQGKEYAGQERATGTALLASGLADAAMQQRWLRLIESQEKCFQVFADFATPELVADARTREDAQVTAEMERLRRVGCTSAPGTPLDTALSPRWFELCTLRMDALKLTEDGLASSLRQLCEDKITQAHEQMRSWRELAAAPCPMTDPVRFLADDATPGTDHRLGALGGTAEPGSTPSAQTVFDLVHAQAERLQAMAAELDSVKATLNERKVIERAKGILMAHQHLNEDDAYRLLRQTAMNQGKRLVDVAQALLSMAEVLPAMGRLAA